MKEQDKLAARIFLILHDPFTGKATVGPTALRCALVGAELAELIISGRVAMENDLVVMGDATVPGGDEISAFVLDSISRQPDAYGVPTWLAAIGDALFELIAARLTNSGILMRSRGFARRAPRFPASNLLAAAGPRVRLEHMIRRPRERDVEGSMCAALLAAVGATGTLAVDEGRKATRAGVATLTEALPVDLRNLAMSVEVAHASGSLPPSIRLRPSNA